MRVWTVTFEDCVKECCRNSELVKQFDRLRGTNLSRILIADTRAPIIKMIDESTGYDKVLEEKAHKEMSMFIEFCYECVWLRLPEECFSEV
jgi:hypothetical protein